MSHFWPVNGIVSWFYKFKNLNLFGKIYDKIFLVNFLNDNYWWNILGRFYFFSNFVFLKNKMSQSRNIDIYKDSDQDDLNVGSEIVHIQNFALF